MSSSALPIPNPCLSFWQQTTRSFPHLHENYDKNPPLSARIAIVGSGFAGSLLAFKLIESGRFDGRDIVMLEAREAASGASSRNAGHVRPDAFRGFLAYSKTHGTSQALKILADERKTLDGLSSFIKTHEIRCDFNPTTTFDVCMTPDFAEFEANSLEAFRSAGGDISHVKYLDKDAALSRTKITGTLCAYEWPAASIDPAKLVHWLLQVCISKGMKLYTHNAALSVNPDSLSTQQGWVVETERGTIVCEKVIHCTNAYADHLLPTLSSILKPNKAQAHMVIPPRSLAGERLLAETYSIRYSLIHFYSLIQRLGDGILVFGVSRLNPTFSRATLEGVVSKDDSGYVEEVANDAIAHFEKYFPDAKETCLGQGLQHSWTGIIGITSDSVPLVGQVPGLDGQYICAGFGGHGMARIFTCVEGCSALINGGSWEDTRLPECFQLTERRLDRFKKKQQDSGPL